MEEKKVMEIRVEDIIPSPFQPRMSFREDKIQELSASIKVHGIIQPLLVRPVGEKYEIVVGERRYKAAMMAGLSTVPAVISMMDDNKSAEVALVENLLRKDLTPIEEAKAYEKLQERGYSQEDIAQKMGISQPAIANKIRLLNLDEEVQKALLEEKISERHARSLLKVSDKEMQKSLLSRVISQRLTVKQLDEEIKALIGGDSSIEKIDSGEEITEQTQSIIETPFTDITSKIDETNPAIETLSTDLETFETEENLEQEEDLEQEELEDEQEIIEQEVKNISPMDNFNVPMDNLMNDELPMPEEIVNETPLNSGLETSVLPAFTSFEETTDFPQPNFPISDNSFVNSNEEINPFEKNDEFSFPQPSFITDTPSSVLNDEKSSLEASYNISKEDFSTVIKAFEKIKEQIEEAGLTINMETFNFDEYYQLIIKVHKN